MTRPAFAEEWTHDGLSLPCLSVGQPYADRLVRGSKPVENRTWATRYRGPLLIHAGVTKKWLDDPRDKAAIAATTFGAVVGQVELVDCVRADWLDGPAGRAAYPWVSARGDGDQGGPWCWVVKNPRRLRTPIPLRGHLGLFAVPATAFSIPKPAFEAGAPKDTPPRTITEATCP